MGLLPRDLTAEISIEVIHAIAVAKKRYGIETAGLFSLLHHTLLEKGCTKEAASQWIDRLIKRGYPVLSDKPKQKPRRNGRKRKNRKGRRGNAKSRNAQIELLVEQDLKEWNIRREHDLIIILDGKEAIVDEKEINWGDTEQKALLLDYLVEQVQLYVCMGCGLQLPRGYFALDHILAQHHKGKHYPSNFQALCSRCNSRKGTKDMRELLRRLRLLDERYFHRVGVTQNEAVRLALGRS